MTAPIVFSIGKTFTAASIIEIFVIIRKEGKWIAHFLKRTKDQGPTYHNTQVSVHASVSSCFLLTRFAWAIFPLIRNFLDADLPRKLRLRVKCEDRYTEEVRVVGGRELDNISRPEKQRTPSPNKRKAPIDTNPKDGHGDNPLKRSRLSSPETNSPSDPRSTPSTNSRSSQSPKSLSAIPIISYPNDTPSAETRKPEKKDAKGAAAERRRALVLRSRTGQKENGRFRLGMIPDRGKERAVRNLCLEWCSWCRLS